MSTLLVDPSCRVAVSYGGYSNGRYVQHPRQVNSYASRRSLSTATYVIFLLRCLGASIPDRHSGLCMLVPAGPRMRCSPMTTRHRWRTGLLAENAPFEAPMERCVVIGERANGLKA